jgi:hypothetical protein
MKLNELAEKYIILRDKKSQLKADYEGKVAELQSVMDKIEAVLLKTFEESGIESVKTSAGTAYRSTRTQASVADWDAFFGFVKENESWEMLERRCSKAAVEQYRAANDDLPPGLNWREERVVNIRRSS